MKASVIFQTTVGLLALTQFFGCGVRGDPKPPLQDAYIGRGKPSYRDAVKDLEIKVPKRGKKNDTDSDSQEKK